MTSIFMTPPKGKRGGEPSYASSGLEDRKHGEPLINALNTQYSEVSLTGTKRVKDLLGRHVGRGPVHADSFQPRDLYEHVLEAQQLAGVNVDPAFLQRLQTNADAYQHLVTHHIYHDEGNLSYASPSGSPIKRLSAQRNLARGKAPVDMKKVADDRKERDAPQTNKIAQDEKAAEVIVRSTGNERDLDEYYTEVLQSKARFREDLLDMMYNQPSLFAEVLQMHAMEKQVRTGSTAQALRRSAFAHSRRNKRTANTLSDLAKMLEDGSVAEDEVHSFLSDMPKRTKPTTRNTTLSQEHEDVLGYTPYNERTERAEAKVDQKEADIRREEENRLKEAEVAMFNAEKELSALSKNLKEASQKLRASTAAKGSAEKLALQAEVDKAKRQYDQQIDRLNTMDKNLTVIDTKRGKEDEPLGRTAVTRASVSANARDIINKHNQRHSSNIAYNAGHDNAVNLRAEAALNMKSTASMGSDEKLVLARKFINQLAAQDGNGVPLDLGLMKRLFTSLGLSGVDDSSFENLQASAKKAASTARPKALQQDKTAHKYAYQQINPMRHHYAQARIAAKMKEAEGSVKFRREFNDKIIYEATSRQQLEQMKTLEDLYYEDPVTGRLQKVLPDQLKMFTKYVQMKKKTLGGSFAHDSSYVHWRNNSLNYKNLHLPIALDYDLGHIGPFKPHPAGKVPPTHYGVGGSLASVFEKTWKRTKKYVGNIPKKAGHMLHNASNEMSKQADKMIRRNGQDALDIKHSWANVGHDVKKAVAHPTVHNLVKAGVSPLAATKDSAEGLLDVSDSTLQFIQHAPGFREANFAAQLVPGYGQTVFLGETAIPLANAMVQGRYKAAAKQAVIGGLAIGLGKAANTGLVKGAISKGVSSMKGLVARDVTQAMAAKTESTGVATAAKKVIPKGGSLFGVLKTGGESLAFGGAKTVEKLVGGSLGSGGSLASGGSLPSGGSLGSGGGLAKLTHLHHPNAPRQYGGAMVPGGATYFDAAARSGLKKGLALGIAGGAAAGAVVGKYGDEIVSGLKDAGNAIKHALGGSMTGVSTLLNNTDVNNNKMTSGGIRPSMLSHQTIGGNLVSGGSLASGGNLNATRVGPMPGESSDWLYHVHHKKELWELQRLAEKNTVNVQLPHNEWHKTKMDDYTPGPHSGFDKVRVLNEKYAPNHEIGGSFATRAMGGSVHPLPHMPHIGVANHDIHTHRMGDNFKAQVDKHLLGQSAGDGGWNKLAAVASGGGVTGGGFAEAISGLAHKAGKRIKTIPQSAQVAGVAGLGAAAGGLGVKAAMMSKEVRNQKKVLSNVEDHYANRESLWPKSTESLETSTLQGQASGIVNNPKYAQVLGEMDAAQQEQFLSRLKQGLSMRKIYQQQGKNVSSIDDLVGSIVQHQNRGRGSTFVGEDVRTGGTKGVDSMTAIHDNTIGMDVGEAVESAAASGGKKASRNIFQSIGHSFEKASNDVGDYFAHSFGKDVEGVAEGVVEGAGFGDFMGNISKTLGGVTGMMAGGNVLPGMPNDIITAATGGSLVSSQHAQKYLDTAAPHTNLRQLTSQLEVRRRPAQANTGPPPDMDYHKGYGDHLGDNDRRRLQQLSKAGGHALDALQSQSHLPHAQIFASRISQGGSLGSGGSMIPNKVRHDITSGANHREPYYGKPVMPPRDHVEAKRMQKMRHYEQPLHPRTGMHNPDLTHKDVARIHMGEYNPNLHPRGNIGRPHGVNMRPHHGFGANKYSAGTIR
jgi:hypothetical protein